MTNWSDYKRKRRARMIRAGRCPDCGRRLSSGCYCEVCRVKKNQIINTIRRRNRLAGKCRDCWRQAEPNRTLCAECLATMRARSARLRERRVAASRCVDCGGPLDSNRVSCTDCSAKRALVKRQRRGSIVAETLVGDDLKRYLEIKKSA